MYIANHYVRINGKMYIKGERIPDGLPDEKIKWLMEAGAIHKGASAYFTPEESAEDPEDDQTDTTQDPKNEAKEETTEKPEDDRPEELAEEPVEKVLEESAEDPEDKEAEADEEAEAPEIDVMAGIVQDKPEEAKKSERKAKNPAKKQAVKGGKNV